MPSSVGDNVLWRSLRRPTHTGFHDYRCLQTVWATIPSHGRDQEGGIYIPEEISGHCPGCGATKGYVDQEFTGDEQYRCVNCDKQLVDVKKEDLNGRNEEDTSGLTL